VSPTDRSRRRVADALAAVRWFDRSPARFEFESLQRFEIPAADR